MFVSGDDQLVFTPASEGLKVYSLLQGFVGENRKRGYLGRVCDPINYNQQISFEFISRVFRVQNGIVEQIRDPLKILTHSLQYVGNNKSLVEKPSQHSQLVGECLLMSAGDSEL